MVYFKNKIYVSNLIPQNLKHKKALKRKRNPKILAKAFKNSCQLKFAKSYVNASNLEHGF